MSCHYLLRLVTMLETCKHKKEQFGQKHEFGDTSEIT